MGGIISGKKGFVVIVTGELPVELQGNEAAANAWLVASIAANLQIAGYIRQSTIRIVDMTEVMELKLNS